MLFRVLVLWFLAVIAWAALRLAAELAPNAGLDPGDFAMIPVSFLLGALTVGVFVEAVAAMRRTR